MNIKPIGVFDSGFGGITVLKELLKLMPNENYIYLGDNKNIPYGDKSKKEIVELSSKMAEFLINKNCKILVIACNTISASAYKILKEKYNIPIIEVISNACKDAINKTENNNISIMATDFTVKAKIYLKKIKEYNKDIKIKQIACKKLCSMIENNWQNYEDRFEILNDYIKNIDLHSDTLILACTHYPLIIKDIKKVLKQNKNNIKNIVDASYKTALSVKKYLKENNLLNECKRNKFIIHSTLNDKNKAQNLLNIFLNNKEYKLELINLD
ncbi:glutamate racemase [Brachyspira aalborgi]|uniref:glutamate racemase n=1 Tax=Brachyspira aalborgi TaxID=29522 RepID=UPI00266D467A|nr:glutamate racemase [Brachyspira aalborgi]